MTPEYNQTLAKVETSSLFYEKLSRNLDAFKHG